MRSGHDRPECAVTITGIRSVRVGLRKIDLTGVLRWPSTIPPDLHHFRGLYLRSQLAQEKKRSKKLERELLRKEKALAETAALLVLRKKINAIWGESEDD